jgi:DNA-binding response OmpR family regulator
MSQLALLKEPSFEALRPSSEARARRILIVDQDAEQWLTLAELLRLNGHRVECAVDLVAALARSFHAEIVLLDTAMPPKEALLAVRKLKGAFPEAKVFAVGGKSGKATRIEALRAGFDTYLTKPVRANAIETAINRLAGEAGMS